MTSSNLNKRQRSQIHKIAKDWRKGKIQTPAQLYTRVKEELAGVWPQFREEIEAELDKAWTAPPRRTNLWKWAGGLLVFLVLISGAVALFYSYLQIAAQGDALKNTEAQLGTMQAQLAALAAATEPTATETIMASPTPSPTAPLEPTPTPSPSPVPSPTFSPTPAFAISGRIIPPSTGQVAIESTRLTLFSKEEEQDWSQGETVSPNSSGSFTLMPPSGEKLLHYRLKVEAPPGTYVDSIALPDGWKLLTDTVTGLTTGLETLEALSAVTISGVEISLAAVPEISTEPISGTFEGGNRRTAPFAISETLHVTGSVTNPVTVLGQWADGRWRLAYCQQITGTTTGTTAEYFWSGYRRETNSWLVDVSSEQETQIPVIYLPSRFDIGHPPPGWTPKTIDGLAVLSSQGVSNTQPVPLEWRIDNVQGWFRLEAWAPQGSEAVTYEVVALVGDHESPLKPFADTKEVAAMSTGEKSDFRSIGIYHLVPGSTVVVRLKHPGQEGVMTGLIRVIKRYE